MWCVLFAIIGVVLGYWYGYPYIRPYWVRLYTDRRVTRLYRQSSQSFAAALVDSLHGRNLMLPGCFLEWEFWEREYARRGFRTISLDALVQPYLYGSREKLGIRRAPDEPPIYNAQDYLDSREIKFEDLL